MKRLISTPKFENEEMNIKARVIYMTSLGTIIATLIFVTIISFVAPALIQRSVILAGIMVPACIAVMYLVRFSKLRLAGILLLFIIWLIVTLGSITAGGISAPIFAGYFVIVIISGLISNTQTKLYVTLVCVFSGIFIASAEHYVEKYAAAA